MTLIAGLDVGGAHLKIALVEGSRTTVVRQIACPLWQGLDKLDTALAEAAPLLAQAKRAAVTMTGELSDLFPDRETGVATLVARITRDLGDRAQFWIGPRGFGSASDARLHHGDVGSTNFLATATLIGKKLNDALLIDFGSTTADIIPIKAGAPRPCGLTDAARQATDELVYTGFTRTAVMGVAQQAPFQGQWVGLAREYLATMADVRRILGADLDGIDLHATADGKGKSLAESVTRLGRMLGRDSRDGTAEDWRAAAAHVRELQIRSIQDGAARVLTAHGLPKEAPVVAAGIGADDIGEIARRLDRKWIRFGTLTKSDPACESWATACAPAVSVAQLLAWEAT
jgi:probable H4MPT-linked C1 transfer pathway protein